MTQNTVFQCVKKKKLLSNPKLIFFAKFNLRIMQPRARGGMWRVLGRMKWYPIVLFPCIISYRYEHNPELQYSVHKSSCILQLRPGKKQHDIALHWGSHLNQISTATDISFPQQFINVIINICQSPSLSIVTSPDKNCKAACHIKYQEYTIYGHSPTLQKKL